MKCYPLIATAWVFSFQLEFGSFPEFVIFNYLMYNICIMNTQPPEDDFESGAYMKGQTPAPGEMPHLRGADAMDMRNTLNTTDTGNALSEEHADEIRFLQDTYRDAFYAELEDDHHQLPEPRNELQDAWEVD
jgi:hypothetical protein